MFQSKSKLVSVCATAAVITLYLACDSGIDNAPTRMALFTDPQTGVSTAEVRDVGDQIVQFDAESGTLIWAADHRAFSGWEVDGNEVQGKRHLRVRFGQKDERRLAYLTDFDTGALVDIQVEEDRLEIVRTQVQVPGGLSGTGGGPTLTLEPTTGPPGTSVAVEGRGFSDTTCGANVYFDSLEGQLLGFTLAEVGTFTVTITVPATAAPGEHKIIAQGLVQGQEFCDIASDDVVEAPFTVTEVGRGPFVIGPVKPFVQAIDLRDLPAAPPWQPGDPFIEGPGQTSPAPPLGSEAPQGGGAPLPGVDAPGAGLPGPIVGPMAAPVVSSFEGIPNSLCKNLDGVPVGAVPPDTVGDIGPDHYIQAVNACFAVYDRHGNLLAGPAPINSLWVGEGGRCESNNHGDPDVKYDHLADRWVISQFVAFTNQCIAVSRTSDPVAGGWYLYDFPTDGVTNDYPHFGLWPDAYYMGSQRGFPGSGADAWAFDRDEMLAGNPATAIQFFDPGSFMLPGDLDGDVLPPAGAPNVFARVVDDADVGGVDRLEMFEFHVDFDTPASSTLNSLPDIPTAAFDRDICGTLLLANCVPQPGTGQLLETLTAWPMYRLPYRNFGTHETLVFNHTVDADGSGHAGIAWLELRKMGGAWSIFQQGLHAPDEGSPGLADDVHRWMGSIAMDREANAALGYSVSSDTVFPGIDVTGRLATDPPGTMPLGEVNVIAGAGSQTGSRRFGDYSAMNLDPTDDCTFWYTTEYYSATSGAGWQTRIASFTLNEPPTIDCPEDQTVECDGEGNAGELDDWLNSATATDDCDGTVSNDFAELTDGCAHTGSATVTFTAEDCCGESVSCSATLTVADSSPPQIQRGTTIEIWPPNHKYHEFDLADCVESVTDACDGELDVDAAGAITSIYSDEPQDAGGGGDGHTVDDIVILSDTTFKLRAERQGGGNGRVYGVTFEVTDCAGNVETATCLIAVPHDQSGPAAVDDGPGGGYTVP